MDMGLTQDSIYESRLAVVDMCDDGDIPNVGPPTLRRMQTTGGG